MNCYFCVQAKSHRPLPADDINFGLNVILSYLDERSNCYDPCVAKPFPIPNLIV